MKKYFIILLLLLLAGCSKRAPYVQINNHNIELMGIADTPEKQYQGLSFNKGICPDCGMLFVFPNKQEKTFVMRNMEFKLDIIFINGNKIIKIWKNLEPEGAITTQKYESGGPSNYVLEVNGGLSDKYNIKEGDTITIPELK